MKPVIELLKNLFGYDDTELTVLLYDDRTSEETSRSFRIRPIYLKRLLYGSAVLLIGIVLGVVAFTPLQSLIVPGARPEVREEVKEVAQRIQALEDTIKTRERQLQEMKSVLLRENDTTFEISSRSQPSTDRVRESSESVEMDLFYTPLTPEELVSQNVLIHSEMISRQPDFPASYPVEGSMTRGIKRESGHFGIDIATASEAPVHAIADGSIISSSWTPNYGYVLRIQHSDGYISVYKHCLSLLYEEGDVVKKGDVIGKVGDVGLLSSGPHLHFELWRKGIPLDPKQFLMDN